MSDKERLKLYRQRPDVREKRKAYRQRPEVKARELAAQRLKRAQLRLTDPDFVERNRLWSRQYYKEKLTDPVYQIKAKKLAQYNYQKRKNNDPEFWFKRRCYKHGITPDEFWDLFNAQFGRCAICAKLFPDPTKCKPHSCVVDHDHTTRKVRGLLCGECNAGLGLLGDYLPELTKACKYLESPPAAYVIGVV